MRMRLRSTHCNKIFEEDMNNAPQQQSCKRQGCENTFIPRRQWQKFCCQECKDRYWQEIRKEAMAVIRERYEDRP